MASIKMMSRRGESGRDYAPADYTRLAYIHTDGVARFYTNLSISDNDITTVLYGRQTAAGSSSKYRTFSAIASGYTGLRFGYPISSSNAGFESGLNIWPRSLFLNPFKIEMKWTTTGMTVTAFGYTRNVTRTAYTGTSGPGIPGGTSDSENQTGVPMDIFRVLAYRGDELIREWLPVKKNSTNEIGVLDVISGTFKPSYAADTPFTAGPEL